jgi:tetratricopeptide (TPR) repeat protein
VEQDHPDAAVILEALGQGYMKMYRLADALDCFEKLSQRQPNNTYALMRRAWIYEKMSRFEDVMDAYQHVLEIDPHHIEARVRWAEGLLYGKKEAAEAMRQFEQVRQQDPNNLAAQIGIAECEEQLGHTDEARRQLDELVATHPDDPLVLSTGGKLALTLGREEQAEDLLRRALARVPYSHEANYNYYLCLVQRGKLAEAQQVKAKMDAQDADVRRMAQLTHNLQKTPNNPDVRDEIAQIFMRLGEETEGARWLKTALQVSPGHRPSLEALAEYYERTGKHDLAAQYRAMAEQAARGGPLQPPPP